MGFRLASALVLAVVTLAAHAHTPLVSSEPAAGATVAAPVQRLAFTFGGDVRLTAVTLTDAAGAKHAVEDPPATVATKFELAVRKPLDAGAYVVDWRAVGADTHVVSGEIRFEVAAAHSH
jgi:methionine-rich copper-binding protein CopC